MGFLANLWQAVGSLMALVAVLMVVHQKAGLHWLVLSFAGTPVLAAIINGFRFFRFTRPDLLPSYAYSTRKTAAKILNTGLLFFFLQIVVAVTYMSDSLIIAQNLGASAVTLYAIPERMFSVISLLLSILLTPLWPAYGEAIARGDIAWVKNILKKSLLMSIAVAGFLSLILLTFGQDLAKLWIGHSVDIPLSLLLVFAIWKIIEAIGNSIAMYLNGANVVKIQILISSITGITALIMKIYLIRTIGISGPLWASIICVIIFALIPYSIIIKKNIIKL
jgi:O-antigen/teichoic acid export membrane protein